MKDLALSPFADEDPGVREVASSSLLPCPPQCQGPAELGGGEEAGLHQHPCRIFLCVCDTGWIPLTGDGRPS